MQNQPTYLPLILSPAYKDYIWGGSKIIKRFDRKTSTMPCAESWEASDRSDGLSTIQEGELKGLSLKEVLTSKPSFFAPFLLKEFPLLTKLIDAKESLSIQVHPNEETATLFQGQPKSEMWYIVDAEEGSCIYLGLKENMSSQALKAAIAENALEACMNVISVKPGDCYYIPAGLLHAVGKGCLIYEVQQNSNTTYRLYDWGRKDATGEQRPLHIHEALSVMKDNQIYENKASVLKEVNSQQTEHIQRVDCPFFTFNEWKIQSSALLPPQPCFAHYFILEGTLVIKSVNSTITLCEGTSFLLPAGSSQISFEAHRGFVHLLETLPNISASQE